MAQVAALTIRGIRPETRVLHPGFTTVPDGAIESESLKIRGDA